MENEILQQILTVVTELKQDVTSLKQDVTSLKQGQENLENEVKDLKQDVTGLKQDVTKIKITLETETNKNLGLTLECVTGLIDKTNNYSEISIKVEENDDKIKMLSNVVQGHSEKFNNLKEAL